MKKYEQTISKISSVYMKMVIGLYSRWRTSGLGVKRSTNRVVVVICVFRVVRRKKAGGVEVVIEVGIVVVCLAVVGVVVVVVVVGVVVDVVVFV